jgi:hypothetical protein
VASGRSCRLKSKLARTNFVDLGLTPEFAQGIATAQDLYHKLRDMRDAVALSVLMDVLSPRCSSRSQGVASLCRRYEMPQPIRQLYKKIVRR